MDKACVGNTHKIYDVEADMTDEELLNRVHEYLGPAPVHRQVFDSEIIDLMRWAYEEGLTDNY